MPYIQVPNVVNNINIEEAFLWLLTFSDYDNNVDLRAVNNLEDVASRGQTYTAFPFAISLPPDDGQKPQNLKLAFPNVGQELVTLIREFDPSLAPKVKLELVLSSDPETVEKTIDFMSVGNVTYTATDISFELVSSSIFARKTCTAIYNQAEFPGMFWALR